MRASRVVIFGRFDRRAVIDRLDFFRDHVDALRPVGQCVIAVVGGRRKIDRGVVAVTGNGPDLQPQDEFPPCGRDTEIIGFIDTVGDADVTDRQGDVFQQAVGAAHGRDNGDVGPGTGKHAVARNLCIAVVSRRSAYRPARHAEAGG